MYYPVNFCGRLSIMETIAIISDVHSNLEAFQAVLERIDELGIKDIYSLGDMVGYGPDPVECTLLAENRCNVRLLGNHEYFIRFPEDSVVNPVAQKALDWTRERLAEAGLSDRATDLKASLLQDEVLYIHGSVRGIIDYVREVDYDGLSNFDEIVRTLEEDFSKFKLCFVGHNHQPFLATAEGFLHPHDDIDEFYVADAKLYISVGSVGQPRDRNNSACFVTFDGELIKYHRVKYPFEVTAKKIMDAHLPDILAERLYTGF